LAKAGGQVRQQDWKVNGWRKPVVGKKVQPEDATDDEGLEVGPKVNPEEAVFDESRKLI
jgi:hypothetical protein